MFTTQIICRLVEYYWRLVPMGFNGAGDIDKDGTWKILRKFSKFFKTNTEQWRDV